jgi:AmmeMemoRadiSam system protein A
MTTDAYTSEEQALLLSLARRTVAAATTQQPCPTVDLTALPAALGEVRACFVTLRNRATHDLRGCTGTVSARHPLAEEVIISAQHTALHDPRFKPISAEEVADLHIEISILTPPQPLAYTTPDDLLARLRPGVDGVLMQHGYHRATYLPQVWDNVTDAEQFLTMLSRKMGLASDAWRTLPMTVSVYQSVSLEEPQ